MGAKVITFKTYEKYIDFKNTYAPKVLNSLENFWIGAECTTPKTFYWYDDKSPLPTWLTWYNAEPNNLFLNEFCVFSLNTFQMADIACSTMYKTICEYSN
jgi:hypothetical protein